MYKAVATFLLYIAKLRAKIIKSVTPKTISHEMIVNAKNHLIRSAQQSEFSDEINNLRNGRLISRNGKLIHLDAYLDECQILRAKSRANQLVSRDAIILPYNHYLTFLVVRHFHIKYYHGNHEAVVNEVRGEYYVASLRVLYKKVRRSCQYCKNRDFKLCEPKMAALPKARLGAYERPFTYVGVDYFGPLFVTVGRRREKRWGVIFTCLTIRAVHIEIAHSLDTSSCILCIRNFISRRGMPREIYSENGTNFKATSKVLNSTEINIDNFKIAAAYDDIKWIFNPPAAPHMGGAWERLVRSIKDVLKNIQPKYNFSDETLRSTLYEIEFIINSRPLTFVALDHDDDEALTPNHLLLGSASGYKPIGNATDSLKHQHNMARLYVDTFWRRWIKEYCPIIARRTKWFTPQKPIVPGDIVIVVDENLPRNIWPKAVVLETIVAKDGQVRRAIVKTHNGTIERPATKLAILDVGRRVDDQITSGSAHKGENVADS